MRQQCIGCGTRIRNAMGYMPPGSGDYSSNLAGTTRISAFTTMEGCVTARSAFFTRCGSLHVGEGDCFAAPAMVESLLHVEVIWDLEVFSALEIDVDDRIAVDFNLATNHLGVVGGIDAGGAADINLSVRGIDGAGEG
jgi:hypothetical protein